MLENDIPEHLQHAPAHIREPIRQFFDHIIASAPNAYDASARTLLARYCELLDQLEDVKAERSEKGGGHASFRDKHGQPRIHPLAKYEMQLTNELGKLFRLLGWDQATPDDQMSLFIGRH